MMSKFKVLLMCVSFIVLSVGELIAQSTFEVPDNTEGLHERIIADRPDLMTATNDYERIDVLREWAWAATPYVGRGVDSPNMLGPVSHPNWYSMNAVDRYELFKGTGGVICGGCSDSFAKLCSYYGWEGHYINHGSGLPTTHAQTCVKLWDEDEAKFVYAVEDACYNTELETVNSKGKPVDYFVMLQMLMDGDHTNLRIHESPWEEAPQYPRVNCHPDDYILYNNNPDQHCRSNSVTLEGNYEYSVTKCNTHVFVSPRTAWKFDWAITRDPNSQGIARVLTVLHAEQGHAWWVYFYKYDPRFYGQPNSRLLQADAHKILDSPSVVRAR